MRFVLRCNQCILHVGLWYIFEGRLIARGLKKLLDLDVVLRGNVGQKRNRACDCKSLFSSSI